MADAPQPDSDPKESDKKMRERVDKLVAQAASQSSGCITLGARALDYSVNAAFVPVVDEGFDGVLGEPQAAVMATSYVLKGAVPHARPVCFAFNGGPGSAPVWPHLGALGPKRVVMPYDARMPTAPFAMADNPHSWFEHFDLVFIDPPHTGWSTTASLDARKKLLSVDGDVAALTEVMRIWLTRHKRWSSPVCLAGESYGTMRGAALADKLQSSGVALCGLILISCAMDLRSIVFAPTNDLPYSLFLPAFANVSQYHGLLKGSLAKSPVAAPTVAETFVDEEYVAALQAGARLGEKRRGRVARRIAELTELPQALVEEKYLRISDNAYFFEALRPRGRIVGRLEARDSGPMAASRTREWEFDPGIEAVASPYTMAAMAYFGEQLGMSTETRYEVLSHDVHKSWNWNRGDTKGNGFATTSPNLARAAPQPASQSLRRQWLLRSRHAVQRERLVLGAARHTCRGVGPHSTPLLRCRSHDVHAGGRPDPAQG